MNDTILADAGEPSEGASANLLQMLATIDGRYRLLSPITRGGMSHVMLAEDLRLGRKVALKLLDRARFPADELETGRRRFQREAEIVASLQHPNIVEVIDVGIVEDVPYMALRLIEGRSLGDVIRANELPPIVAAVTTLLEIAAANEYAHRHGVMHRDIKPDNIMLERGAGVRMVDFGLAHIADHYGETSSGRVVGTPAYLAPERLRGERASPASEVFSAGVVAYEYLTGRHPFSRETLFYSIAYEEVIAPSHVRPEIPRPLEAVLLRMLAKRPSERYENFADVRRDLERVRDHVREPHPVELEDERFLAWRTSAERATLVLPFVGRATELETLESALHEAGAGRGSCFAIAGDPGFGKSRLVEEVVKRARLRGMATYLGRALHTRGDVPYQVLVALLHNWAAQNRVEGVEDLKRVASTLPRLEGAVPVLAGLLAFAPIAAREREQLWEAVRLLFEAMTAERPAVIVLEDLHAADAASLALLRYLAADAAERRLLLLFSYRPEEGAGREIATWPADSVVRAMTLTRLTDDDMGELLRRLLVDDADVDATLKLVLRESRGVALFIAEILKHLRSEGVMVARGAGYRLTRSPELKRLPDGIRAVIRRRLETLAPEEREVADVAAVVGDPFRSQDVLEVLKADRRAVLRVLGDLESRYLLVVPDGALYRFSHDLVRQAVYEEVPRALRGEYHRLYAQQREALGHPEDAPLLARHYGVAGFPIEAARWHRVSAEQAEAAFAHALAIQHYEQALALDARGEMLKVLLCLGNLRMKVGEYDAARAAFERAAAASTGVGDAARGASAELGLGKICLRQGSGTQAIEHCRAGLDLLGPDSPSVTAANLHAFRAQALELIGDGDAALVELQQAVATARKSRDDATLADVLLTLSRALKDRGRLEDAEATLLDIDALSGVADPAILARAFMAKGSLAQAQGRLSLAQERYRQGYEIASERCGPDTRAMVAVNLAFTELLLGEFAVVRRLGEETTAYARRTTHRRLYAAGLVNYFSAVIETGDLAQARTLEAEGLVVFSQVGDSEVKGAFELLRACLEREVGHLGRAEASFERVMRSHPALSGTAGFLSVETPVVVPARARERLNEALAQLTLPRDGVMAMRARCALARVEADLGNLELAEQQLATVDRGAESKLIRRDYAQARGVLSLASGALSEGVKSLAEALSLALAQPAMLRAAEIHRRLVVALRSIGDLEGARSHAREGRRIVESVRSALTEEDAQSFQDLHRQWAAAEEDT